MTSLFVPERFAFVSLFSYCPKETGVLDQECVGISISSANFRNSLPPTASLQYGKFLTKRLQRREGIACRQVPVSYHDCDCHADNDGVQVHYAGHRVCCPCQSSADLLQVQLRRRQSAAALSRLHQQTDDQTIS